MPNPRFNKFYRYAELTRLLKEYAREHPDLLRLESIGKSHEGRDVWLVTVTSFKSGSDAGKPAFWVDGNIHASEVTASAAALYLIHSLVTKYKQDPGHHPRPRYPRFLHRPARQSRWSGVGAGRPAQDHPLEHARIPPCRGPDRRSDVRGGYRWRWTHPADARRGPERRLEGPSPRSAQRLESRLQKQGFSVSRDTVESDVGRLYRVRVGPFEKETEAAEASARIKTELTGVNPRVLDLQPDLTAPVTNPNDPLVRWVVQLGVFNDSGNAQKLVEQLRSEGMTAYSETISGKPGTTYRVRVGPFLEHEEATRTQQQLSERQKISGVVMTAD